MPPDERNWLSAGPFTVFDLETTGMSPTRDRIIEIGAVRIELDGSVDRFETLVNPRVPIPARLTAVHGISDDMVSDAPDFTDAGYRFLDFIKGSKLVAHNARFDLAFLQESLARCGLPLVAGGAYDSIVVIRQAYPGRASYSLQALRAAFPLPNDFAGRPHRSAYDAECTFHLFRMSMDRLCASRLMRFS